MNRNPISKETLSELITLVKDLDSIECDALTVFVQAILDGVAEADAWDAANVILMKAGRKPVPFQQNM